MTQQRLLVLVTLGIGLMLSFSAGAEDKSNGCGLGWKIAPSKSLISTTTRAYVNVTFSNTLGMTSGTSGCEKHSIVQEDKKVIHYAEANFGQLMIEMAQGDGEHFRGLAITMGCTPDGVSALGKASQQSYTKLFPAGSSSPAQMLHGMRSLILEQPSLQDQCGYTG